MYRFWEPFILGVVAETAEARYPGQRSVFINNSNEIQFSIRILSTPPHSFPNSQRVITCWGSDLEQHGFEDHYFDKEQRIQSLIDFLDGQLLVFQVEKRIGPNVEYFTAKNIHLLPKKASFTPESSYIPVPLFTENKDKATQEDFTWEQFIQNLNDGTYIGRNEHVSREPEDTPRILLYKTIDNEYYAVGEFISHHYAHGGFSFESEDKTIKYNLVDKKVMNEIYNFQDVMFVGMDQDHEIITSLQDESATAKTTTVQVPMQDEAVLEEKEVVHVEKMPEPASVNEGEDKLKGMEEAFMEQFLTETKKMNLMYNTEDLYNFHTCVKTGGLTILAGMSGTGKSQLVNAYQKGLHLDADKFLMIPVSPTWTDDTDLIGYPDIVNNVYRPADTGLVNLLIEAEKNRSETFVVCFDEMNLAKVEHYFSQFLSVLEMEKGRRKLKLYNRDLQNKFYNGSYYPPEVLIGDNVIFTGTVNLDESTHQFSDKVLDRSNLLTLHVEPFTKMLLMDSQPEKGESKTKNSYAVHAFIYQDRKLTLSDYELEFLWNVHQLLNTVTPNMGIGPRIVKQIDLYIKNLSHLDGCPIDREKAFDLQFAQRILPKIRGSEEMLQHLLGVYNPDTKESQNSKLIQLFDEYDSISEFEKSRLILSEKAKELTRNGYTI